MILQSFRTYIFAYNLTHRLFQFHVTPQIMNQIENTKENSSTLVRDVLLLNEGTQGSNIEFTVGIQLETSNDEWTYQMVQNEVDAVSQIASRTSTLFVKLSFQCI